MTLMKYPRLTFVLGWVIVGFTLFLLAQPPSYPTVYPDELCRLGWARWLAGGEFYSLGTSTYCQPLYPLLIAPLYLLADEPQTILTLVFLTNSALAAACVPLAWTIARQHFNLTQTQSGIVAASVLIFPALTLHSHHVWPEAALYPALFIGFFSFCHWIDSLNWRSFTWLVLSGLLLYALHRKMLVVPLSLSIGLATSLLFVQDEDHRKRALLTILLIALTIYAFSEIRGLAMARFWNSGDFAIIDRFTSQSIWDLGRSVMAHSSGVFIYAAIATGGASWILIGQGIRYALRWESLERQDFKILFPATILMLLVGLTALFFFRSERFDAWFYGRHVNAALAMALIPTFYLIAKNRMDLQAKKIAIVIPIICFIPLALAIPGPPWKDFSPVHVIGSAPYFDFLYSAESRAEIIFRLFLLAMISTAAPLLLFVERFRFFSLAPYLILSLITHFQTAPFKAVGPAEAFPAQTRGQLASSDCRILWDQGIQGRDNMYQFWRLQYHFPNCQIEITTGALCDRSGYWLIVHGKKEPCPQPMTRFRLPPELSLLVPHSSPPEGNGSTTAPARPNGGLPAGSCIGAYLGVKNPGKPPWLQETRIWPRACAY